MENKQQKPQPIWALFTSLVNLSADNVQLWPEISWPGLVQFDRVFIYSWPTCVRFSTFQYFLAAFDILNKSGDTLTVKELSLLFGKEETADAIVMENFLRKIIKDHNDQTEVSLNEFKMLVSKDNEFRGIQKL